MEYLLTNKLLSNKQFGFIPIRSYDYFSLLCVLDEWTEILDQGAP